jgi:hypothetical protein
MARATTVGCPAREPGLGGLVFYGLRVRLGPSYLLVYPTMVSLALPMPGCPVEILGGHRIPPLGCLAWV